MKSAEELHKELVVDILSKSFDANGSVNYVVKQDEKREHRIRLLMEYSFEMCRKFGEVFLSNDEKACVLLLYPDRKRTTLNSILWDVRLAVSVIGLNRIGKILKREARIKSHHPTNPFCYLWFIGVSTNSQNQGKGTLLLQEVIAKSRQDSRQIYLETSMLNNLPGTKNMDLKFLSKSNCPILSICCDGPARVVRRAKFE